MTLILISVYYDCGTFLGILMTITLYSSFNNFTIQIKVLSKKTITFSECYMGLGRKFGVNRMSGWNHTYI